MKLAKKISGFVSGMVDSLTEYIYKRLRALDIELAIFTAKNSEHV